MSNLTDAERDELHHAVLRDVIAAGETVPNVYATAETIVAAHVRTERDRLLARIEELIPRGASRGLVHVSEYEIRALVGEERAR